MKKAFFITLSLGIVHSFAQTFDNQRLSNEIKTNFNSYFGAYLRPFTESFGAANGLMWQIPHKAGAKFNINLSTFVTGSLLPETYKSFDFNTLNKVNFELVNPNDNILPTLTGGQTSNIMRYFITDDNGNRLFDPIKNDYVTVDIDALEGLNLPIQITPSAGAQLGIWTPVHTGLALRYVPNTNTGAGRIGLLGIGIIHDIAGWFKLPLEIKAGFSYQKLDFSIDNPIQENPNPNKFTFNSTSRSFDLTIGKYLWIIKPYLQISRITYSNELLLSGRFTYEFDDYPGIPGPIRNQIRLDFEDPVDIKSENSMINYGAGLFINLGIFYIQAQYMLGTFTNAGVAFGFKIGF